MRVSNSLNPDQDGHFVRPDLGPNCLKDQQQRTKSTCWQAMS